jgi:glycogen debranching enzyme
MSIDQLRSISYNCLLNLATEKGINASGKNEIYGCIFGRDSAITMMKMLKVLSENKGKKFVDSKHLLEICKRSLLTLTSLQGKEMNIESGEEPGKFIHEYRTEKFEHLLALKPAWYLYPDQTLRNYDSLDATPLALIAIYRYFKLTHDISFISTILPAVEKGLGWIMTSADKDGDGLVEYAFHKERKFGGLKVQSWTDSLESIMMPDGSMPEYPIAPVEVQGYTWLALKLWADFYKQEYISTHHDYSEGLFSQAQKMKKAFNTSFLFKDSDLTFPAQVLDGRKRQIQTVTGNPLLLLWATYFENNRPEAIIETRYIQDLVKRSFMTDMFDKTAGVRTMSSASKTFDSTQNSYHNGSYWPKLNGMAHEGLRNWGYIYEARILKKASLVPLSYFGSPIELYIKTDTGEYLEYKNAGGQVSCRDQAWSAASALDLLTL